MIKPIEIITTKKGNEIRKIALYNSAEAGHLKSEITPQSYYTMLKIPKEYLVNPNAKPTETAIKPHLYVDTLEVAPEFRYKGVGRALMLDTIRTSLYNKVGGRILLIAGNVKRCPWTFYGRLGFVTDNPTFNKEIADAIKNKKELPIRDEYMFLPLNAIEIYKKIFPPKRCKDIIQNFLIDLRNKHPFNLTQIFNELKRSKRVLR